MMSNSNNSDNNTAPPGLTLGLVQPASQALQRFWDEWQKVELNSQNNSFTLPPGVYFMGQEGLGSTMYFRKCYADLASIISEYFSGNENRVAVIGNPGIGKSYFLFYLLKLAIDSNHSVIYHSVSMQLLLIYYNKKLVKLPFSTDLSTLSLLDNPNTWYLVDEGAKPVFCSAKTVLISSPNPENYSRFLKDPGSTMSYMPPWKFKEILSCREICYPHLSSGLVAQLYGKWGGLPRYVLEKAHDPIQQALLDRAIEGCRLGDITYFVGETYTPDSALHKVMHMHVAETGKLRYIQTPILFASPYVAYQIANQIMQENRKELLNFVGSRWESPTTSPLRANLFEGYAHALLAKGGTFSVRNLTTNTTQPLTLPLSTPKIFYHPSELAQFSVGEYGQLFKKKIGGVDSVFCGAEGCSVFQMGTGEDHGVKVHFLDAILGAFPSQTNYAFYFVVPEDKFSTFGTQQFITTKKEPFFGDLPSLVQRVTQFSLEIKLS